MNQSMLEGKVAGCTFFKISMEEWTEIKKQQKIKLERDKSNPYDKYAIKVMLGDKQIGWISKPENQEVSNQLDTGVDVEAHITRIFGDPMDRPHIELSFYW